MRQLVFADIRDGDSWPANPSTPEGAAACFAVLCPSLTPDEAKRAARTACARFIPASRQAMVREMFEW